MAGLDSFAVRRWQSSHVAFNFLAGKLQTWWLNCSSSKSSAATSSTGSISSGGSFSVEEGAPESQSNKLERQIDWITEVLHKLLTKVVARRQAMVLAGKQTESAKFQVEDARSGTVLEEVTEVIKLGVFSSRVAKKQLEIENSIDLGEDVRKQLRAYIECVAYLYNQKDNAFHNFSHVCHVIMSVSKLLSRIVAPVEFEPELSKSQHTSMPSLGKEQKAMEKLAGQMQHATVGQYVKDQKRKTIKKNKRAHDHTFGITSDPLVQFACIFSALIHDGKSFSQSYI